ncbi:MAG: hypothetical protein NC229_08490 [Bacteroides sp.]|nr:hypothetical protein [Bacteroidales bacterium]MCM1068718.1 hypothetical protein [Prevotella sp.]MCM1354682.1 hypothetical protein [Bacteroides sp.]MCM1403770.1 hypothetical protein [Bacteroides sp.]MCM1443512.1 hypothetical protein [Muribaculum sp.]
MTIGDLLNTLASKCGMQNNSALIELLSSSDFANHEVNDELAKQLDGGLMSLEGAKNNREVLNHLKPIILKAADDKFAILAEKYGFANENQAESSTYKKIDLLENRLAAKLSDLEKRANGTSGEDVTKLTKQINDLQKQLQTITTAKDNELAEYKKQASKKQLEMLINFELNGKRYANQDLGETNILVAKALVEQALKSEKAVLVNENGTLRLKQADNPSLDYIDGSYKTVSFTDFANRILADKHMLEVSSGEPKGGIPPIQQTTITLPNGKQVDTSKIDAAAASSIADLQN